jgi:hypothetical protein
MKSRSTITTARILALAAMFAAALGVHAFHILGDCSGHEFDCGRSDLVINSYVESGDCHDHDDDDSTTHISLRGRGLAVLIGSCPVCDFLKTRPVQSCFDSGDLRQTNMPPSQFVIQLHTPISRRREMSSLSRAPPAAFPTHIV